MPDQPNAAPKEGDLCLRERAHGICYGKLMRVHPDGTLACEACGEVVGDAWWPRTEWPQSEGAPDA